MIQHAIDLFRAVDPDIHRKHVRPDAFCHLSDRGCLLSHGCRDCRRDFLPRLAHALCHNAVIRAHDDHRLFCEVKIRRAKCRTNLCSQGFKCSKPVERLRDRVPVCLYLFFYLLRWTSDLQLLKFFLCHGVSVILASRKIE